mgnify:CR=1 FL=1
MLSKTLSLQDQPMDKRIVNRPPLEILSNGNYRNFLFSVVSTQIARWMWLLTTGFTVLRITDSIFSTQMVGVASAAPLAPVGIVLGIFGDTFNRKQVLLIALLIDIAVGIIATLLILTNLVTAWILIVLSFVIGASLVIDQVIRRALVMDLLGKDLLPYGIALDSFAFVGGIMLGPLISGALIDLLPNSYNANIAFVYGTMTICFIIGLFLLKRTRYEARRQSGQFRFGNFVESMSEGFRTVGSNRAVIGIFGITLLFNMCYPPIQPLIPVFAEKVLNVGPSKLGLLAGSSGLGALFGLGFILSRPDIKRKSSYYIFGTMVCIGFLFIFSLSQNYFLSIITMFIAGVGFSGLNSMQPTLILLSVAQRVRARVLGIHSIVIGVVPLSSLLLGFLAERWGPGQAVTTVTVSSFVILCVWARFAKEMRKL